MNLKFKKIGYVYQIDKNDFDICFLFSDNQKTDDEIREFVLNTSKEYGSFIEVSECELFLSSLDLSSFNSFGQLENRVDDWEVIFEIKGISEDEVLKNGVTKQIQNKKVQMPINEFNKMEDLMNKWYDVSEIFHWQGSKAILDQERFDKVKELIIEIEKAKKEDNE